MKRIILLLTAAMILSFCQTEIRADESALFLDNKAISGDVDISGGAHTLRAEADGTFAVIAVYENGELKAVSFNKSLTYNFLSSGTEIKLFNWNEDMQPFSRAVQVSQNEPQEYVYVGEAACTPDEEEDFSEYLVTLEVVTVNGKITEIRNISGYEYSGKATSKTNASYLAKAAGKLVSKIISKQSTKVDAVSGATCASYAIMDAVDAALKSEPVSTPKPTAAPSPTPAIDDGVYSGSAQALGKYLNYMVDVDVTVENGVVTEIEDKTLKTPMSVKDKELYQKAWNVLSGEITAGGNTIDMVSGATVSSAAITEAVENALSTQVTAGGSGGTVYAPEGISLYSRVYPTVTVTDGKISDIRIVPVSGTDTETLSAFADEIKRTQSVKYPSGSDEDVYNIASLIDQILYGKGVLDDE